MQQREPSFAIVSLIAIAVWIFVVLPLIHYPWPSSGPNTFWGLDGTAWTAVSALANVAYCLLTAGLLIFAIYQVLSTRNDAKINRTLTACDRYDTDPVLDAVTRRLSIAFDSGDLKSAPAKYRIDLFSLFNYFESIAIGVDRGLYTKGIVRDQLEAIIIAYVDDLVISGLVGWSVPVDGEDYHFKHTMRLYFEWKAAPLPSHLAA